MRREKKRKILIITLIGLLLIMAAGYAAFQTNLNIKGTSKINSNWDIRITNVEEIKTSGSGESNSTPTWTNLTASMDANLYDKGDSVEYEVTIENKGTFDAKLEDIIKKVNSNNEAIKISFSGYTKGEKLYKNTSQKINVKIEYDSNYEGVAPEGSGEVEITLDYGQAEGGNISPTNDYLVTYDYKYNGGESSTAENEYVIENEEYKVKGEAKKTGYEFIGWNTDKNAKSGIDSLTMPSENIILYAIYKKEVNISYGKGNGISSISKEEDTCEMYNQEASCEITLPSIEGLSGYSVLG